MLQLKTRDEDVSFDCAVQEYRAWKHLEGTLNNDVERRLDKLRHYFKNTNIRMIGTKTIVDYSLRLADRGLRPNTIKRELNQLRAVLRYAEKIYYEYRCPDIKMPKVNDERDVHLESDEATAVLNRIKITHPKFYHHFLLLIDTGARLNEMLRLTNFSFCGDVTRIERQHLGKSLFREIPMTNDITSLTHSGDMPKNLNIFSSPQVASATLGKVLKQTCHDLGIKPVRIHDLRHTFAYLTAKAGADLGDLKYLMGHSDIAMTLRYRGFIPSRAKSFVRSAR